jgi:fructokinase
MADLRQMVVVGLGEVLWDCFGQEKRPGGATANVAFHAQQLGHTGIICSRVGQDGLGQQLGDTFAGHHLDIRYIQHDPIHPTGTVTVDTARPDRPTYIIHQDVAWDYIEFTSQVEDLMHRASAVCFGTLAQRSPRSRETIQKCLLAASGALRVMDINLRQTWYDRQGIVASLGKSNIAKLNIDEVSVLASMLNLPPDPAKFAGRLRADYNLEIVCITRAEQGALLVSAKEVVDVAGLPTTVADTVGAGDAFSAALIAARLRGWSLSRTAAFANAVGSLVASRPGAMPALQEEYGALL